ncbi:metallophosphoesterase family protein [Legionella oakridgensis]|uniref:metallophosphoesterase family protein n=1 Tax=Legionella oakridgensis TaxID=29423 RepID=UPI0003DE412D|nr:metallophosphoesterase [Legionella oakridgensis]ETO92470.1 putative phosphohydrolase [Legionella oakridgensis RV-2-2007]
MKIVHISDLHFGMHHEAIINAFLADVSDINPSLTIISGDLTQRAKSAQYKDVQAFIKKLPGSVFTVPGNHDIPLWNIFSRLFHPFALYRTYVHAKLATTFENEEVRLLGVNSVMPYRIKSGQLAPDILTDIDNYFTHPFNGLNILFFHHNFDYMEGMHKPLKNYYQFLTYLKNSNIHMVCTGHLHYANASILKKNNHQPCLVLHAGSLCCQRSKDGINSYYVIEIEHGLGKISWRVFNQATFITSTIHEINFSKRHADLQHSVPLK